MEENEIGGQVLTKIRLIHSSGCRFVVNLTNYEINRAETDPSFLNELTEKYYKLYKRNLVMPICSNTVGNEDVIEAEEDAEITIEETEPAPSDATLTSVSNNNNIRVWTDANIRMLIDLYKIHKNEFESGIKKVVWKKIAKSLCENTNTHITWTQCDTKFKGLKEYYKNVKKHNDTSGNNYKYWAYSDALEEILGRNPEITAPFTCSNAQGLRDVNRQPVPELQSSVTRNDDDDGPTTADVDGQPTTPNSAFQFSHIRRKRKLDNTLERRHREKMERQDRYLDLFERLVNSLENKQN